MVPVDHSRNDHVVSKVQLKSKLLVVKLDLRAKRVVRKGCVPSVPGERRLRFGNCVPSVPVCPPCVQIPEGKPNFKCRENVVSAKR